MSALQAFVCALYMLLYLLVFVALTGAIVFGISKRKHENPGNQS